MSSTSTNALLARVDEQIVGLRREAEVLAATLASGCHVVLDGPPGTGKSTLLRAVADGAGFGVEFVEGNAELTPARLVGHFDPALVLETGYKPDMFVDGPLITALREGKLLYIEELNRVPEETLNVLVGALAEGEIHVPRLGHVKARESFRLIAAMNPFDAVGTARVSQAISDRMCRIAVPYQDEAGEREIVERVTGRSSALIDPAVELTRLTREHAQVRMGASVRGAIDLVRLGRELSGLRGEHEPGPGDGTFADAAIAALSGRLRLDEGTEKTAEAIILELIERLKPRSDSEEAPQGKAPAPGRGAPGPGGRPVAERRRRARGRQGARPPYAAPRPARRGAPAARAGLTRGRPARGGGLRRASTQQRGRGDRAARRSRGGDRSAASRPGPAARGAAVRPLRPAGPEHAARLSQAHARPRRGGGRPRPRPDP